MWKIAFTTSAWKADIFLLKLIEHGAEGETWTLNSK